MMKAWWKIRVLLFCVISCWARLGNAADTSIVAQKRAEHAALAARVAEQQARLDELIAGIRTSVASEPINSSLVTAATPSAVVEVLNTKVSSQVKNAVLRGDVRRKIPEISELIASLGRVQQDHGASSEALTRLEKELEEANARQILQLTAHKEEAVLSHSRTVTSITNARSECVELLKVVNERKGEVTFGELSLAKQGDLDSRYASFDRKYREFTQQCDANARENAGFKNLVDELDGVLSSSAATAEGGVVRAGEAGQRVQEKSTIIARQAADLASNLSTLRVMKEELVGEYLKAKTIIAEAMAAKVRASKEREHAEALRKEAERQAAYKAEEASRNAALIASAKAEKDRADAEAEKRRIAEATALAAQQEAAVGGTVESRAADYATGWMEADTTEPTKSKGLVRYQALLAKQDKDEAEVAEFALLEQAYAVDPTLTNVALIKTKLAAYMTGQRTAQEGLIAKTATLNERVARLRAAQDEVNAQAKELAEKTYQLCDPLGVAGVHKELKDVFKLELPAAAEKLKFSTFMECVRALNDRYRSFDFVQFNAQLPRSDQATKSMEVPFSSTTVPLEIPAGPNKVVSLRVPIFNEKALADGFFYKANGRQRAPFYDTDEQVKLTALIPNIIERLVRAYCEHLRAELPADFHFMVASEPLAQSELLQTYAQLAKADLAVPYFVRTEEEFIALGKQMSTGVPAPLPVVPVPGGVVRTRADDLVDLLESLKGDAPRIQKTTVNELVKKLAELKALNTDMVWTPATPMSGGKPGNWMPFAVAVKSLIPEEDDATATLATIRASFVAELHGKGGCDSFAKPSLLAVPGPLPGVPGPGGVVRTRADDLVDLLESLKGDAPRIQKTTVNELVKKLAELKALNTDMVWTPATPMSGGKPGNWMPFAVAVKSLIPEEDDATATLATIRASFVAELHGKGGCDSFAKPSLLAVPGPLPGVPSADVKALLKARFDVEAVGVHSLLAAERAAGEAKIRKILEDLKSLEANVTVKVANQIKDLKGKSAAEIQGFYEALIAQLDFLDGECQALRAAVAGHLLPDVGHFVGDVLAKQKVVVKPSLRSEWVAIIKDLTAGAGNVDPIDLLELDEFFSYLLLQTKPSAGSAAREKSESLVQSKAVFDRALHIFNAAELSTMFVGMPKQESSAWLFRHARNTLLCGCINPQIITPPVQYRMQSSMETVSKMGVLWLLSAGNEAIHKLRSSNLDEFVQSSLVAAVAPMGILPKGFAGFSASDRTAYETHIDSLAKRCVATLNACFPAPLPVPPPPPAAPKDFDEAAAERAFFSAIKSGEEIRDLADMRAYMTKQAAGPWAEGTAATAHAFFSTMAAALSGDLENFVSVMNGHPKYGVAGADNPGWINEADGGANAKVNKLQLAEKKAAEDERLAQASLGLKQRLAEVALINTVDCLSGSLAKRLDMPKPDILGESAIVAELFESLAPFELEAILGASALLKRDLGWLLLPTADKVFTKSYAGLDGVPGMPLPAHIQTSVGLLYDFPLVMDKLTAEMRKFSKMNLTEQDFRFDPDFATEKYLGLGSQLWSVYEKGNFEEFFRMCVGIFIRAYPVAFLHKSDLGFFRSGTDLDKLVAGRPGKLALTVAGGAMAADAMPPYERYTRAFLKKLDVNEDLFREMVPATGWGPKVVYTGMSKPVGEDPVFKTAIDAAQALMVADYSAIDPLVLREAFCLIADDFRRLTKPGAPYNFSVRIRDVLLPQNPKLYEILDPDNAPEESSAAGIARMTPLLTSLMPKFEELHQGCMADPERYDAVKPMTEWLTEFGVPTEMHKVITGGQGFGKVFLAMKKDKGAFKLVPSLKKQLADMKNLRLRRMFVELEPFEKYVVAFMDAIGVPDDDYYTTLVDGTANWIDAKIQERRGKIDAASKAVKEMILADCTEPTIADRVYALIFTDMQDGTTEFKGLIDVDIGLVASVMHRNTSKLLLSASEMPLVDPKSYSAKVANPVTGVFVTEHKIMAFESQFARIKKRVDDLQDADLKKWVSYDPVIFKEDLPHDLLAMAVAKAETAQKFKEESWDQFFARFTFGWGTDAMRDDSFTQLVEPLFEAPRFIKKEDVDLQLQGLFMRNWRQLLQNAIARGEAVIREQLWGMLFTPTELRTKLRKNPLPVEDRDVTTILYADVHNEYSSFLEDFVPTLKSVQKVVRAVDKIEKGYFALTKKVQDKVVGLRDALLIHIQKQLKAFSDLVEAPASGAYPQVLQLFVAQEIVLGSGAARPIGAILAGNATNFAVVQKAARYVNAAFTKPDGMPWVVNEGMLAGLPTFLGRQELPEVLKIALQEHLIKLVGDLRTLANVTMLSQVAHRVARLYDLDLPTDGSQPKTIEAMADFIAKRSAKSVVSSSSSDAVVNEGSDDVPIDGTVVQVVTTVGGPVVGAPGSGVIGQGGLHPTIHGAPGPTSQTGQLPFGQGVLHSSSHHPVHSSGAPGQMVGGVGQGGLHHVVPVGGGTSAAHVQQEPAWLIAQRARDSLSKKQNTFVSKLVSLDRPAYGDLVAAIDEYDEPLTFVSEYGTVVHAVVVNPHLGPEHKKALLERLLAKNSAIDFTIQNSQGDTVLHDALKCKAVALEEVEQLKELFTFIIAKMSPVALISKNKRDVTPLDVALRYRTLDEINILLHALHAAGHDQSLWIGKDPLYTLCDSIKEASNDLLTYVVAALNRALPVFDFVLGRLEDGGLAWDVNRPINKDGETALHFACRFYGEKARVREVGRLKEGAPLTVKYLDEAGEVVLITKLLTAGANKEARNRSSQVPVQVGVAALASKNFMPLEGELNPMTFFIDLMTIGDSATRDFVAHLAEMTGDVFGGAIASTPALLQAQYGLTNQSLLQLLFERLKEPAKIAEFIATVRAKIAPDVFKDLVDRQDAQGSTTMHTAFMWALRKTAFEPLQVLLKHTPTVGLDIPNRAGDVPLDLVTFKILRREAELRTILAPFIMPMLVAVPVVDALNAASHATDI